MQISIHALRGEGDIGHRITDNAAEAFQSTPSVGRATPKPLLPRAVVWNFNPRPPWGGRRRLPRRAKTARPFQSTPSVGRATPQTERYISNVQISIHALRGEGDNRNASYPLYMSYFNPRPPWGGRPIVEVISVDLPAFQSTPSVGRATFVEKFKPKKTTISIHALRGEGDDKFLHEQGSAIISIHALRGEGDTFMPRKICFHGGYFNPRPPWGGRRAPSAAATPDGAFQSTPSVGRATIFIRRPLRDVFISIHALRGEGDGGDWYATIAAPISIHALRGEGDRGVRIAYGRNMTISIHALRGEGDQRYTAEPPEAFLFQSTPSVGRATNKPTVDQQWWLISIHALRGEGDPFGAKDISAELDFNPRPPWGGRQVSRQACANGKPFQSTPSVGRATIYQPATCGSRKAFQSTPSVGRATKYQEFYHMTGNISIHALRGEGDARALARQQRKRHFNPRPPWGGRQTPFSDLELHKLISIHALRGEGDFNLLVDCSKSYISIHALRGEGDQNQIGDLNDLKTISIHALRGEGDVNFLNE